MGIRAHFTKIEYIQCSDLIEMGYIQSQTLHFAPIFIYLWRFLMAHCALMPIHRDLKFCTHFYMIARKITLTGI